MNRNTRYLTPEIYDLACDLVGSALLRRVPAAATLMQVTAEGAWEEFSCGVYIAADYQNTILYVGSTARGRSAQIGDRVQEHVRAGRARRWTRLMVIPLRADTPPALTRRIEGRIGLVLRPVECKKLPSMAALRRAA